MRNPRYEFGKTAEKKAAEWFLRQEGYQLLSSNFRCRWGEIDLIFEQLLKESRSLELVFVEVKARSQSVKISGLESIDWKKRSRLHFTAQLFLSKYRGRANTMRFDLLYLDGRNWTHLPNFWG